MFVASLAALSVVAGAALPSPGVAADGPPAVSDLDIHIDPGVSRINGVAEVALPGGHPDEAVFALSDTAAVSEVRCGGRPAAHRFDHGRLRITCPGAAGRRISLTYTAVFDDPVPVSPINTDNPGYGVTGSIGAHGVFLLGGAGWYPFLKTSSPQTIRLSVDAPEGMLAVTAGRLVGHHTSGGRTRSDWEVTRPVGPLSLSAAYYRATWRKDGPVAVATYLLAGNTHLADTYLSAVQRYIALYSERFGPYPFDKFAVVENFFPTGYGFPSYTLLGTRVLRLPFIPHTSLGHEVAHCWWGNGVFTAPGTGNWSEGLTTYVADHLYQELKGASAAAAYRRQWLRNYAVMVPPAADFPLDAFRRRTDPVSKVIGYDKGAMVFHMLRKRVGDARFWEGLRRFYAEKRFQAATWEDLRSAFEAVSGQRLDRFFDQWVRRTGAPSFAFDGVSLSADGDGYRITGRIGQAAPAFDVDMVLAVEASGVSEQTILTVSGPQTPFAVPSDRSPAAVVMDPENDVFRRLSWREVPPTVNSLKDGTPLAVVAARRWLDAAADIVTPFAVSMGVTTGTVMTSDAASRETLAGQNLLLVGVPEDGELMAAVPAAIGIDGDSFTVDGHKYQADQALLVTVFRNPFNPRLSAALLMPLSQGAASAAIAKITHYGKYSTLVFEDGRNRLKTTWPVTDTPMRHVFP